MDRPLSPRYVGQPNYFCIATVLITLDEGRIWGGENVFVWMGVTLLEKYRCNVGILSLKRYGSTGPTFQLRLIRIMVQLFGGNLEQEKRKRSGGSLNLSCPNFPFVCVSKWGSVPKLPTTNSTQMDRTFLLIRYLQSALLQFHQTRYLTYLNRGQHVFACLVTL